MIRELLNSVEYGWIASAALLLFFGVFVAVTIRTIFTDKKTTNYQADIPLTDGQRRN